MKKIKQFTLALVAFSFIFSSCSVEKRVHLAGYHVNWKKNKHVTHKIDPEQNYTDNQEKFETKINNESEVINSKEILAEENISASTETAIVLPKTVQIDLNKKVVKTAIKNALKTSEGRSVLKEIARGAKKNDAKKKGNDVSIGLLYLLCILFPVIAVGIVTDWDIETMVYNLLWCLLCYLPGVIHAFIVVKREY